IMPPGKAAGHAAAEMLDRLLGGQPASACCRIIPCAHVAVRKSTDSLAIDDLLIARVLRLLRRDATSELDMNVIRRAVPLSKRSLEIRFKRAVGRTMEQEVARVRVEQAKRLLARSELRLEEVAAQSGFSCAHRMTVVFSRATGIPPSEYRRRSQMQQVHLNGEGNGHPGE
ncbi:MAG TPA: helix-turn-helix domain-containing protein, partial [Tepidisphaeraceae bacterium]|nr:helix-turn-helix domain-containing protein [Tepidisphaeraceae bacterium]